MRAPLRLAFALALVPTTLGCTSPSVQPSPDPAGPGLGSVAALVPSATETASAAPPPPVASAVGGAARRPAVPPAEAAAMLAQAEKCLADPACTEDGEALLKRADDAGAADLSCFRFYHGIGVTRDLPRARACFAREVAAQPPCGGSSPDLDRVILAAMLIDAQGGPAEPARAEALFAGCFKDAAVSGVLEEIPKRSQPDPTRAPLDFCEDIGGTTLSIGQCHRVDRARILDARLRVDRLLFPKLDAAGQKLAARAREAWSAFAVAHGALFGDRFRGGSLQSNADASRENHLEKQRAEAVAQLFDYKLSTGADPAAAARELEKQYHEVCGQDAERRKLCAASRKAWATYRDAEVALYVRALGASLGEKEVARDLSTRLTQQYAAELEYMTHE